MSYPQKPINVYQCEKCGGETVTVDREEGVTPFMIRCRADAKRGGMMSSTFYMAPQDLAPTYEWRKPTPAEYKKLDKATRKDHVDRGGLLLYRIEPEKRIAAIIERSLLADAAGNLLVQSIKRPKQTASMRREKRRQNARDLIARFA